MALRVGRFFKSIVDKWQSDGFIELLVAAPGYLIDEALLRARVVTNDMYFPRFVHLRYRVQQLRYTAPAIPYEPIKIDPGRVDYILHGVRQPRGVGQIDGGDWDTSANCKPIEDSRVYEGLKQRFERNLDWEDTVYYEEAKQAIEDYGSICGYRSPEQYKEVRCGYVDDLFASIRDEGYHSGREAPHDVPDCDKRSTTWVWSELEPLVAIGRNGEIYLNDGRHRFTIARILGLESIPVNVSVRHREWQRVRDMFASVTDVSELSPELRVYEGHPDLQDVVGG